MKLDEAKADFIRTWGTLGSAWGVNRTLAQIHALLLVSPQPLDTDEIMARLKISRGNANMNLRALLDWELIYKEFRPGVRKEFFRAETDGWTVAKRIASARRKREIDPLLEALQRVVAVQATGRADQAEVRHFKSVVQGFLDLGRRAASFADLLLKADQKNLLKSLGKFLSPKSW
jgi:DNA-binding transcriptional regulator GbsR (MarR family)